MVRACGVVVSASRGVAERVVCVIYLLELPCAGRAFGRVGGDTVGMRFKRLSVMLFSLEQGAHGQRKLVLLVRISDLLLGCARRYLEDRIWTVFQALRR